jgi:threonine dehydratase
VSEPATRILRFPDRRAEASTDLTLARVHEAARRLRGTIRRTPTLYTVFETSVGEIPLHLKLENQQREGGVEYRGVMNAVLSLEAPRGLVSIAGGGAYPASLAAAGERLQVPVWMHAKRARLISGLGPSLAARGVSLVTHGSSWSAAERTATEHAQREGFALLHPDCMPEVIAGEATVALEMLATPTPPSVVVIPANAGGAVLAGAALAIKETQPGIRVVGVEVTRAPRLHASRQAGKPVRIETPPGYAGPAAPHPLVFDLCRRYVDDIVLISAEEADDAVRRLFLEVDVPASASGATAVAAVLSGKVRLARDAHTHVLVAGSGEGGLF